jgi:phosphopantetheinyl transferase
MFHSEKITFGEVDVYLLYYENFLEEEHLHNLLPEEHIRLEKYHHPNRRREFIATRVLRTMVFGNEPILYSEIGAPYIEEEGFISISHAPQVVGLAFSRFFPVGLDLEPIREKVLRVAHKFLSDTEKQLFDMSDMKEMIKTWSGKEALYKLAGRKGIHFAKELAIQRMENGDWRGEINCGNVRKKVHLSITERQDFVISVNPKAAVDV